MLTCLRLKLAMPSFIMLKGNSRIIQAILKSKRSILGNINRRNEKKSTNRKRNLNEYKPESELGYQKEPEPIEEQ